MELATIEMDKDKAQRAFEDYRCAVRERHDAEDEAIMRAYKKLADGASLIRLSEVMANGGAITKRFRLRTWRDDPWVSITLPRLAVCRAYSDYCWTNGIEMDGSLGMCAKRTTHPLNTFDWVRLPAHTFDGASDEQRGWQMTFRAMVPKIPPHLRPRHKLQGYHILWEAEWKMHPPPAPEDPVLLKHIGGDLYAVLATWDLTEVERAVLAGRPA